MQNKGHFAVQGHIRLLIKTIARQVLRINMSNIKASSPGLDNIPHWFYRACSYEIAEIVTHILNLSFDTSMVPRQ